MALTKVTYSMIQGACVNVLDYGAIGDGVANDAPSIAAAVATGKNVYFPKGTYYYNSNTPTSLSSNQSVFGDGQGVTVIKSGTDANGSYAIFNTSSEDYVSIANLTFDGNSTFSSGTVGPNGDRSLFRFSSCNNINIDNIEIKNYGQKESGTIPLANPENYAWAASFGGCSKLSIEDVYLHDCYVEGFAVYNCTQVELNNFRGYLGSGNCSTPLHIAAFGNVDLSKYINVSNVFIDGSFGSAFNLSGEYININNVNIINPGSVGIDSGIEGLTAGQTCLNLNYSNVSITGSDVATKSYFGLICSANNVNLTNVNVKYCEQNIVLGATGTPTSNYSLTNCNSTESRDKTGAAEDYNIVLTTISNVAIDGCVFQTSKTGPNAVIQFSSNLRITKSTFADGAGGNIQQRATQFGWIQNCVFDQSAIAAYSLSQIRSADAGGDPVGTTANIWLEGNYFVGSTAVYAVSLPRGQYVFTHNNINANVNAAKNLVFMDTFDVSDVITDNAATFTFRNPLDFGNGFVWVSSTGKLFIKSTRPANDTDGTIVGTQT
jgi:hypothetical protein